MLNEQIDIKRVIEDQRHLNVDLHRLRKGHLIRGHPIHLISGLNRAELFEYLQEVCQGDSLLRQTYYTAVSYVDLALSRKEFRQEEF
jgi:hypothetical protein